MLFSQRKGLKPPKKLAQIKSIDDELRVGLWNALHVMYWKTFNGPHMGAALKGSNLETLFGRYWHSYFKWTLDTIPYEFCNALAKVKEHFFSCDWNEVYDLLEFTARNGPPRQKEQFEASSNNVLERENAGYRFVGDYITEITAQAEIESVEEALRTTSPLGGVHAHFHAALDHLSDRQNPNYRNSIKESISAVEAICQIISRHPKASLGVALAAVAKGGSLHPALNKSFSALYGYTSDADGIRHAMLEEEKLTFTDAKYMLVACTAFVNYLVGKATDLGIPLNKRVRR